MTTEGYASDELQTDFNGTGVFLTEEFEIQVPKGGNCPCFPAFTLYNCNTDDEDNSYYQEVAYDKIEVNKKKITSITPFKCDKILENLN